MNKYIEKVNALIKSSMISKDSEKTKTYRLLKSALVLKETEDNAKEITEDTYLGVIQKMVKQRKDSIKIYQEADRQDLVDQENTELQILQELLPKETTREEIEEFIKTKYNGLKSIPKSDFGILMGLLKKTFPGIDGKLASDIIKENIG